MSSGIRQSALVVLTVVALTGSLWLVPAEAGTPAGRYSGTAFAATNQHRTDRDLRALRQNACLQRFATRWAAKMGRGVGLEHQSLQPIMRRCDLTMAGENIAFGYPTGRAVVRGWMHSQGHRENILRPQFRLMAIGAYRDGDGRWWSSQVFGRS
jgi:uncharacterized protein YkwD